VNRDHREQKEYERKKRWTIANIERVRESQLRWLNKGDNRQKHTASCIRWQKNNLEKVKATRRIWNKKNHDKLLEQYRAKRLKNPEAGYARTRKWYLKNRPRVLEYNKWRHRNRPENPFRIRARNKAREALKKGATIGNLTDIAKVYERARWWKQWFDVVVDHICPLSKGGAHAATNLQIIYASENLRKHARLNYNPQVVFV